MRVPFDDLPMADLVVGNVYEEGSMKHYGADPVARLMPVGNQGGFRIAGRGENRIVVLYTTLGEPDWPDSIDPVEGILTYYGDNRTPGQGLHDPRGNSLLRDAFGLLDEGAAGRGIVPPFFVFEKMDGSRDVRFRGLAVPGEGGDELESLVAIWRRTDTGRFLNYRAQFTLLDDPRLPRRWIDQLLGDEKQDVPAPAAWEHWRRTGVRVPLRPE